MDAKSLCDMHKDLKDFNHNELIPDAWAIVDKWVDAWIHSRPENPPQAYDNPWEEIIAKQEE